MNRDYIRALVFKEPEQRIALEKSFIQKFVSLFSSNWTPEPRFTFCW